MSLPVAAAAASTAVSGAADTAAETNSCSCSAEPVVLGSASKKVKSWRTCLWFFPVVHRTCRSALVKSIAADAQMDEQPW
jgi:hypothetical protein